MNSMASFSEKTRLPGVLGDIADIAGEEAALAMAQARGGTEIYLPPAPDADHWLSQLVGHEAALAIADHLTCGVGGLRLELPNGPTGHGARAAARVDRMLREGRSERDIAIATGYTTRGVRKRRARLGDHADDRQMDFFSTDD